MAFRAQCVIIFIFGLVFFAADRILKFFFVHNPRISGDFIEGIFRMRFEKNYGLAFGFPPSEYNQKLQSIFIGLVIVMIAVLIYLAMRSYYRHMVLEIFSFLFIIIGAMSNLLDRFWYGYVIDYIDVPFFSLFNIADVMISVGVIIVFVNELLTLKRKRKNTGDDSSSLLS